MKKDPGTWFAALDLVFKGSSLLASSWTFTEGFLVRTQEVKAPDDKDKVAGY